LLKNSIPRTRRQVAAEARETTRDDRDELLSIIGFLFDDEERGIYERAENDDCEIR
jgi:hypothetical protein